MVLPYPDSAFDPTKDDIIIRSAQPKADENERNVAATTNAILLLTGMLEEASKANKSQEHKVSDSDDLDSDSEEIIRHT